MKSYLKLSAILAPTIILATAGMSQVPPPKHSTAESDTDPSFVAAAANHVYAQKLVNELRRLHPDVKVIALHATRPGATGQTMIAANLDRIGKEDDEDDQAVVKERKSIVVPRPKPNPDIEMLIPAEDARGNTIGLLGLLFTPKHGETQVDIFRKGTELRNWLAVRTSNLAAWFAPADLGSAHK